MYQLRKPKNIYQLYSKNQYYNFFDYLNLMGRAVLDSYKLKIKETFQNDLLTSLESNTVQLAKFKMIRFFLIFGIDLRKILTKKRIIRKKLRDGVVGHNNSIGTYIEHEYKIKKLYGNEHYLTILESILIHELCHYLSHKRTQYFIRVEQDGSLRYCNYFVSGFDSLNPNGKNEYNALLVDRFDEGFTELLSFTIKNVLGENEVNNKINGYGSFVIYVDRLINFFAIENSVSYQDALKIFIYDYLFDTGISALKRILKLKNGKQLIRDILKIEHTNYAYYNNFSEGYKSMIQELRSSSSPSNTP